MAVLKSAQKTGCLSIIISQFDDLIFKRQIYVILNFWDIAEIFY